MAPRELISLSLYSLLASNRSGLFLVFLPLYLVYGKGASVPQALALVSLAYVAASLFGPWMGRWSDRVGRRRPFLLAGELIALPLFVAMPFLPGFLATGAAFIGAEIALAIGGPALNAYVADLTAIGERGRGYGLLNASTYLGGIAGFVITGFLAERYGYVSLFPFVAAVIVGNLAVILLLIPDRPVEAKPAPNPTSYGALRKFSVAVSIRALGIGAVGTFYSTFALALGASALEISAIAIAGLATGALVSLPFGRWVDRSGEIRSIRLGTVITLGGIAIFFVATSWPILLPAGALRVAGLSLLSPAMLAWVAHLAPPDRRAEYLGVFSSINSTLWSLGPLGGAAAYALAGSFGLFTFAIGTTAISLVAIEVMFRRPERASPTPDPGASPLVGVPVAPSLDSAPRA